MVRKVIVLLNKSHLNYFENNQIGLLIINNLYIVFAFIAQTEYQFKLDGEKRKLCSHVC